MRGVSSTFGARGRRFEKFRGGGGVNEGGGAGAACCCCCCAGVKAEMSSRATGPAAAGGLACVAAGASVTALGFRSHAVSDVCGMALRSSIGGARCGGCSIKALSCSCLIKALPVALHRSLHLWASGDRLIEQEGETDMEALAEASKR